MVETALEMCIRDSIVVGRVGGFHGVGWQILTGKPAIHAVGSCLLYTSIREHIIIGIGERRRADGIQVQPGGGQLVGDAPLRIIGVDQFPAIGLVFFNPVSYTHLDGGAIMAFENKTLSL